MSTWPLFAIRIITPRLELRFPTDDLLFALADVAAAGVHPPEVMPFVVPWTRGTPADVHRNVLQYQWRCRAEWSANSWQAPLVVLHDGKVIGCQGISADAFATSRSAVTGSWLGSEFQGLGYGKEMRVAALQFAFDGLQAEWAFSGAALQNGPSNGVSAWIGYELDGHQLDVVGDEARWSNRYRISRESWMTRERELGIAVQITGLDSCRDWFDASVDASQCD